MDTTRFLITPYQKISLKDFRTDFTGTFKDKKSAAKKLKRDIELLAKLQDVFYSQKSYGLLIILQGMDTAGKDGTIKHIMSGVNPQGVEVHSFKQPSEEELAHDYLWRTMKAMPQRGWIGIFNRTYYEEVLIARVRPEVLAKQNLPPEKLKQGVWKERFDDIGNMERYLTRNGFVILKFFLHISKEEQKKRLLERIDAKEKNWKFSAEDLDNRGYWRAYMNAYEKMLTHTSTKWAPWYVIPSDHKWFARAAVADIIVSTLQRLNVHYPTLSPKQEANLAKYKKMLERE